MIGIKDLKIRKLENDITILTNEKNKIIDSLSSKDDTDLCEHKLRLNVLYL